MSYRYMDGKDGRRYCFNVAPSFLCPMAEPVTFTRDDQNGQTTPVLMSPEVALAAESMGMIGVSLAMIIRSAHVRSSGRKEVNGHLTDTCVCCGAKMSRRGFRCWIEAPEDPVSMRAQMASTFGFSGYRQIEGPWFKATKAMAREWAAGRVQEVASV